MLSVLSCGGQIVNLPGVCEAAFVSETGRNLPHEYSLLGFEIKKKPL
jgi:hypothetical protein